MKTEKQIEELKAFINDPNVEVYYDENGKLIINGNVTIFPDNVYTYFPVQADKLIGSIRWYGGINHIGDPGTLTSMKNFPKEVTENIFIHKNHNLKSLDGCPERIGGTLQADRCDISDISGIAKYIGISCILDYNPIDNLKPMYNSEINGVVSIIGTPCADDMEQLSYVPDTSTLILTADYDASEIVIDRIIDHNKTN